jgi:FkbM family methyltransferase
VLNAIGDIYAFLFGWPAAARMNRRLFYLSSRALGLHNSSSPALSGEMKIIGDRIGRIDKPVVFDVGANIGSWSSEVLRINSHAQIHAFEPQAALASHIATTFPQIKVTNAALGDSAGELELYDYANHSGSQHASLIKGVIDKIHGGTPRVTRVPLLTIDDYCLTHRIEQIHFLKVDVEGFELTVLRGAQQMIAGGRVDAVQFEFNEMNVLGRTLVNDFLNFFGDAYSIYRILPHGLVQLKAKDFWFNEQLVYQNLLAVKRPVT